MLSSSGEHGEDLGGRKPHESRGSRPGLILRGSATRDLAFAVGGSPWSTCRRPGGFREECRKGAIPGNGDRTTAEEKSSGEGIPRALGAERGPRGLVGLRPSRG
jgi:hypothetical protein